LEDPKSGVVHMSSTSKVQHKMTNQTKVGQMWSMARVCIPRHKVAIWEKQKVERERYCPIEKLRCGFAVTKWNRWRKILENRWETAWQNNINHLKERREPLPEKQKGECDLTSPVFLQWSRQETERRMWERERGLELGI
jgi:hypothetical protein